MTTTAPNLKEQLIAHFEEAPRFTVVGGVSPLVMLASGFIDPFGFVMCFSAAVSLSCAAGLIYLRSSIDARANRLAARRAQRAYPH